MDDLYAEAKAREEELYLKVKMFLFDTYLPADSIQEGFTFTTAEVYNRLQNHLPGNYYHLEDVASWLLEAGYKTFDKGNMKLEWMIKKKNA